jgi:serine/threonine protein kinase
LKLYNSLFKRELSILFDVKDEFFYQFYGFSDEPNHFIVTKYIPNENLHEKISNKIFKLSPSQKTIIAIVVR